LGDTWNETILWYARGVRAMRQRPQLSDRTSWRFLAAMHGVDQERWGYYGYLTRDDQWPTQADMDLYWDQCQHGTWYFLPWHRGYLLAFEAIVRAAIVSLNGPQDWALPYWNYFDQNEAALPAAFASPDWPDGTGDNPLYVPARFGPQGDGNVYVALDEVNMTSLDAHHFTGLAGGGHPGFGGAHTPFEHGASTFGALEDQPHNWVHGLVGGPNLNGPPNYEGLMGTPPTAALDPIFWLHHANIDRLWEVWRRTSQLNVDPPDQEWLTGPPANGRPFVAPKPDGSEWRYHPSEMVSLETLGYTYEELAPVTAATPLANRIATLRAEPKPTKPVMTNLKPAELVGATKAEVPVVGKEISATVHLDSMMRRNVTASLRAAAVATPPDKVLLNIENVTSKADSPAFHVFVKAPDGTTAKAGSIALFGARQASIADGKHGGSGVNFVLDISKIVDQLHLKSQFDVDQLEVKLEAVHPISAEANVKIGRISIYRQASA
jgi:tyrosinase